MVGPQCQEYFKDQGEEDIIEVTMMYNRPTTEDLIEAMEVIAKQIYSHSSKVNILLTGCLKLKGKVTFKLLQLSEKEIQTLNSRL